jgi:hypothetical protein
MEKLDFKRKYKELWSPKAGVVSEVMVPKLQFLVVDGRGDPNGPEFAAAVGALYATAYTLKFWSKKHEVPAGWMDFGVAPLEALWDVTDGSSGPTAMDTPRDQWLWKAMIMQPEFVTTELVAEAKAEAAAKKPEVDVTSVKLEAIEEGAAVQLMHIGPYSAEAENIMKLDAYMKEHGYTSNGLHHEVYLGDPRRTAPEKLKTVLRHPVRRP